LDERSSGGPNSVLRRGPGAVAYFPIGGYSEGKQLAECMVQQGAPADTAQWPNPGYCQRHFRQHRSGLGVATVADYDRSARATIRAGRRFSFTDRDSGQLRVGYYEVRTRRFTALTADERRLRSHYRTDDASYPRRLPDSTY
jgi:hypothetical protein